MNKETKQLPDSPSVPDESNIFLESEADGHVLRIPPKGFKGKGLITLVVIVVWLFTILVWTVLLLNMKPLYVLYSIPLWAIGFWTLIKSTKILRLEQFIILNGSSITLRLKRGNIVDERQFNIKDVDVGIVEGSYYSFTGLNKRGQYPAIIYNKEAFGFAERCSATEKEWIVNFINAYLTGK